MGGTTAAGVVLVVAARGGEAPRAATTTVEKEEVECESGRWERADGGRPRDDDVFFSPLVRGGWGP